MSTETTTGHTPGPWKVVSGAVETGSGIPIASMDRESGNGTLPVERDENARLIAAAPDLRSACSSALAFVLDYSLPSRNQLEKQLRAVLEQAGGDTR